ncbi:hypothetical protein LCGC14_2593600 [marine sediment metagenome]|uniref:Uncharacterized protein n=1 Tax=marine sediment metagenome TaxID=412755 RepID=A0A0F9CLX6_9ZZZZ
MARPIPVPQLSIGCQSPWAIVHAACPQGPIFQAWDGKTIFCPCACHVDRNIDQVPDELAKADTELTRASDLALRPGLEPREHGFIKSVLELRAALDETGILDQYV